MELLPNTSLLAICHMHLASRYGKLTAPHCLDRVPGWALEKLQDELCT